MNQRMNESDVTLRGEQQSPGRSSKLSKEPMKPELGPKIGPLRARAYLLLA